MPESIQNKTSLTGSENVLVGSFLGRRYFIVLAVAVAGLAGWLLPEEGLFVATPLLVIASIVFFHHCEPADLFSGLTTNLILAVALFVRNFLVPGSLAPLLLILPLYGAGGILLSTCLKDRERVSRDKLEWLSNVDGLTEVYNHRYFQLRLAEELARADRGGASLALAFVDIDHFKGYNDQNGHLIGDLVLKKTAAFLNGETRVHDIVCRYGGDEFVIILPETDLEGAAAITARLVEKYKQQAWAARPGDSGDLTLSAGISAYPHPAGSCEELTAQADQALYMAKEEGRNRSASFIPDIGPKALNPVTGFCYNSCEASLVEGYRALATLQEDGDGRITGLKQYSLPGKKLALGRALGIGHILLDNHNAAINPGSQPSL